MLYKLEATSIWSNDGREYEKLMKEFPCLKNFDIKLIESTKRNGQWIRDENGDRIWQENPPKIIINPYIEISTIEELNNLMAALDENLVLSPGVIEIYDCYRE